MKVLGVSVTCKFTKALEDGSFKTVSLSTDAQLEDGEDASEARRALYAEVAGDLKAAFSNDGKKPPKENPIPKGTNTGKKRKKNSNGKPETKICPIHKVEMPRHTNGKTGGKFHSHRLSDGSWCHGNSSKKGKK